MKKMILIAVVCTLTAAPAMADMISFVDSHPLAGVDGTQLTYGGTSAWSTGEGTNNLGHSYSLLGGNATVAAYVNGSNGFLSHRLTRGLGVVGGEPDEIDRRNVNGVERIEISFDVMPYYVTGIEVRSLFNVDTDNNAEWAAVRFDLYGGGTANAYLEGDTELNTGLGEAIWTGSYLVNKLVFYVPAAGEINGLNYDASLSEFAVAKLDVTPIPVPGAFLLTLFGLGAVGIKRRRRV